MVKLAKHNRHWNEGFYYEFKKKRELFNELIEYLDKQQIVAVTGLRRVGKTVLLKQVINHLIQQGAERHNILYFSFDEEAPELDELINEYAATANTDMESDSLFIFLDEIQKLNNWQEQIKVFYDNFRNIKFFVSGSESLFIRKKSRESLAGRIFVFELPVLNFREFLLFREKEELLKNTKMFKDELKKELLAYFRRSFIEIIDEDEKTINFYLESIINKVVYEDIPSLFPVENPEKLKAIVRAIYSSPGMIIKYESLANDLNLSSKTVEKYLSYLLQSNLIKKIYNFSRNFLTSEKKLKRFYVTAPCFCFLNSEYDVSKIAENVAALSNTDFFWRDPYKKEVDFILKTDGKPYPVEVKYRDRIRNKELKGLLKFMDKFKVKAGTVITKNQEEEKKLEDKKIEFVPLWKWMLL